VGSPGLSRDMAPVLGAVDIGINEAMLPWLLEFCGWSHCFNAVMNAGARYKRCLVACYNRDLRMNSALSRNRDPRTMYKLLYCCWTLSMVFIN
jgi:hypothetical protein